MERVLCFDGLSFTHFSQRNISLWDFSRLLHKSPKFQLHLSAHQIVLEFGKL